MTYKEVTHEKLLSLYKQYGKEKTIALAEKMLHTKAGSDDVDFKRDLHGEICETVLEILILEEMKRNPRAKNWVYCKGMILKNRDNTQKEFFTEMDIVLFTPECIFLFECKSYTGDKVLVGNGILKRASGNSCDVFSQSLLHKEIIEKWMQDFVVRGRVPVIQMCMFDFSSGEIVDKRSRAAKAEMPCLNASNVMKYVTLPGDRVWDIVGIAQAKPMFDRVSSQLRKQHLTYVRELHRKG